MKSTFVYSEQYDFGLNGIEQLHPFDSRKYSRAWTLFKKQKNISTILCDAPADDEFLHLAHDQQYLQNLQKSTVVAQVIEIALARFIPNKLLQTKLLKPARFACHGTWLATQSALQGNIAMNFAGGYHHAFQDHGEGFCFFADAALSIIHGRHKGLLKLEDEVLMIDLDAHRGNGFESFFKDDPKVKIFDMYNFQTYPGLHPGDIDEFRFMVPLRAGMQGQEYLEALYEELPIFLDSSTAPKLVFYNAGSDILEGDPLGGLKVSFEDVLERDRYVIEQLHGRGIPTVVMTSGGYSKESYKLVAELANTINKKCTETKTGREVERNS